MSERTGGSYDDALYKSMYILLYQGWRGGATGIALDLRSTDCGFKSYLGQKLRNTLGKLFTPVCLCHQAL